MFFCQNDAIYVSVLIKFDTLDGGHTPLSPSSCAPGYERRYLVFACTLNRFEVWRWICVL